MPSLSASRLIAVLVIAVCTLCASAAVLASDEERQLSKSVSEEALTSRQEAQIPSNMMHSASRQASSARHRPEISMSSSLFFDTLKGLWMYSYTSTAEFKQAGGPDGYTAYNPEKNQSKGSNTKAASSIAFDRTKGVYVVTFTYSTELKNAP
jgi:hypothetical protein